MNLKKIGLGAMAATAVVAGSALASAPAQAASIGSRLGFLGFGNLQATNADFNGPVSGIDGVFSGLGTQDFATGGIGTIKGLTSLASISSATPVNNFISFGSFSFNLTSIEVFTNNTNIGYNIAGVFSDGTRGVGSIVSPKAGASTFYAGNLEAVPTPALLPGLLAMGVGMLRKRKAEAVAEANSEA